MKNIIIIGFLLFIISSCIEELEEQERVFEKVFGFNGNSQTRGITRISDNSILIYGYAERSILSHEYKTKDSSAPFLAKLDPNGNQIISRTYPIDQVKYNINIPERKYKSDSFDFLDIEEINNGKLLAIVGEYPVDYTLGFEESAQRDGYLILDKDLHVEKFVLFDDSEIEFKDTLLIDRSFHKIFKSPINNEVYILATESHYLDNDYNRKWETGFYSIYCLSPDGLITNVFDFKQGNEPIVATDMTFDDEGNAIVIGNVNIYGIFSYKTFFHRIDLNSGRLINNNELENGTSETNFPKIKKSKNFYVVGEIENSVSPAVFATSIFDNNFTFMDRIFYTAKEHKECWLESFITMKDGGFAALSFTCMGLLSVYRLDNSRNEIWRWELDTWVEDGYLTGQLYETSDGGISIVTTKEFNTNGFKITVIKLSETGKLIN